MTMKRVIGITQGGERSANGGSTPPPSGNGVYALDDSEMLGCTYSLGSLLTAVQELQGGFDVQGNTGFTMSYVDQSIPTGGRGTGYAPGGSFTTPQPAKDGKGNWIVDFDFPGIDPRDKLGLYRDIPKEARYSYSETVDVHLRRASPMEGLRSVPGLFGGSGATP